MVITIKEHTFYLQVQKFRLAILTTSVIDTLTLLYKYNNQYVCFYSTMLISCFVVSFNVIKMSFQYYNIRNFVVNQVKEYSDSEIIIRSVRQVYIAFK